LLKWSISKSISSISMQVIEGLIVNYDIPRQIFDICPCFVSSDLQT